MKKTEKLKARELRKKGYSVSEIAESLNLSKSTVSLWVRGIQLDADATNRLSTRVINCREKGIATLRNKKKQRLDEADTVADNLLSKINQNQSTTLVALSMANWCEGAKNDIRISFANSDAALLKSFINMLEEVFKINRDKIKICVHIHDYHDEGEILMFWSRTLNIPLSQFTKTYKKASDHKFKKEGYMGCVRITYHDAHIARVLLSFAKKFIRLYI